MTRTFRPRSLRLASGLAALAALGVVTACGAGGSDAGAGSAAEAPAMADEFAQGLSEDEAAIDGDMAAQRSTTDDAGAAEPVVGPGADVDLSAPAVISTGWVSLESEDVSDTRFELRKVVDAHQGTITEQETTTREGGEVDSARLVIRVPSDRFAAAFADFEAVASLRDSSSTGEDVSAEVVDVDARVRAQRKSVARIEALLARAETIEQVVSIESQLATRQADLDALLSRQQWLADQTSQSTITVYVEQPSAAEEPDNDEADGFIGGLRDGWDAFVDALVAGATVVGFAVPWLILLGLLGLPLWLALHRRRHAAPSA